MPDSSHVEAPTLTSNGLIYPAPEAMDLASGILAQLTEGVVTLADDDSVVSWNPGAASLTGYTLPEQVSLLFSPFHTTKPAGTGLGLYLVQEIVTAHHGEITMCSTLGVGTTCTVVLPRLDAAATSLVTG